LPKPGAKRKAAKLRRADLGRLAWLPVNNSEGPIRIRGDVRPPAEHRTGLLLTSFLANVSSVRTVELAVRKVKKTVCAAGPGIVGLAGRTAAEWNLFEAAGPDIASQNHGSPFHAKAQGVARLDSFSPPIGSRPGCRMTSSEPVGL